MNSPLRKQCLSPADSSLFVSYDEAEERPPLYCGFCFRLVFPAKPLNAKASGSPPFFSSPRLLPQPPLKTSVKGGTNGADGEVFSSSSFLSHEKTFPFLSPLYLSLSPQENEPLCPFFALSSPFLQVDFFLFIPSSPWKDFPFSVPSSRREGGRQGEWAKKMSAAP